MKPSIHREGRCESARTAARFVVLMGVVSLLADATYEGARGLVGPYLLALGASATAVGFVAGFGELVGYGLRLASGPLADRTQRYWALTAVGYLVSLAAVPALALARWWEVAGLLVILERAGKALRTPARDAMLSYAGSRLGAGRAFGLHEALDQVGAVAGPLLTAAVLALSASYRAAFLALSVPAGLCLFVLAHARAQFPQPSQLEPASVPPDLSLVGSLRPYLVGVALVAAGLVDFPLLAYHFTRNAVLPAAGVPFLYALAMAADALAALLFGRWFDRRGVSLLVAGTAVTAWFAPVAFLGGTPGAVLGAILWGAGLGLHESVLRAAVGQQVPPHRRASAFGLFHTIYGLAWFAGSAAMGFLYDRHPALLVTFALAAQLAALPWFLRAAQPRSVILSPPRLPH